MREQLPSYYLAQQIDRESLDRRAAKAWIAASAVPAAERRFSLKVVAVTLAVALAGMSGTAAALAGDEHSTTSAITDVTCGQDSDEFAVAGAANLTEQAFDNRASVAPEATDEDGDVIPMPHRNGRPW